MLMSQEAIRVEERTGEEAVPILAHDDLATVQVPGQDEVIAAIAARLPDPRVVSAQDFDVRSEGACRARPRDCDGPLVMGHSDGPVVDPLPAAILNGAADAA